MFLYFCDCWDLKPEVILKHSEEVSVSDFSCCTQSKILFTACDCESGLSFPYALTLATLSYNFLQTYCPLSLGISLVGRCLEWIYLNITNSLCGCSFVGKSSSKKEHFAMKWRKLMLFPLWGVYKSKVSSRTLLGGCGWWIFFVLFCFCFVFWQKAVSF